MKLLARELAVFMVSELGTQELLGRLSDPFWFQALGCVLGFDWHSSGVTTTTCGALKEGLKDVQSELGIFVCGGKGGTSRKTPLEVTQHCDAISLDAEPLVYASKLSAKIDSAAVQDGFQVYHHSFFFTADGHWAVVQQGMNEESGYARRYHWLSDSVEDYVCEPHAAVCCDRRQPTLNMVAQENVELRTTATEVAQQHPDQLVREVEAIASEGRGQLLLFHDAPQPATTEPLAPRQLHLPARHELLLRDLDRTRIRDIFFQTYEQQPPTFEALVGMKGVGPKSLRALSLIAELVYGTDISMRDPARFSFAHGGKDGIPYPVDRETYDQTIDVLHHAINKAGVERSDKVAAFKRLAKIEERTPRG